ncbi:MAG: hypothetical protein J0I34_23915 [Pseudonocardia sp.]|uniref:hypothetical protein n=1 Tax=unclassified Pseudonocardia TaxID=2619320 RepID=UPI00086D27D5|nr:MULTISPECIES: hypothetical protein [unclassified Pseudonocardia]MBN9111818.1 hypothetical protein [Pseudonocardia sp.]ODU20585.1 MAG: hypothetical protein ABS80_18280 [Pseudonocardia sp. SCN 72-51]ODV06821.1 MAG: hypothetical protein ABT15_11610 [Pseudonocardia sp. SCN 73-27]
MNIEQILIAVLVLAWIVYRQVVGQYASRTKLIWLPLVLIVVGLYTVVQAHPTVTTVGGALIGAELVLTVVLGWVRGRAVSLETREGFLYLRGGVPALVLWLISIGMRVGVELFAHSIGGATAALATSTIALSFGISLAVQGLVLRQRIRRDGRPLQEDSRRGDRSARATLGR